MRSAITMLTVGMTLIVLVTAATAGADGVAERRQRVLAASEAGAEGMPVLRKALRDGSFMVRRAAVRGLASIGAPARAALVQALTNKDPVVRRAALVALASDPDLDTMPCLTTALADDEVYVRQVAIHLLVAVEPRTDEVIALLQKAEQDEAPQVHRPAALALVALDPDAEPFELKPAETVSLRERPEMADQVERIITALEMRLPREGWKFRRDTRRQGHWQDWFAEGYDDTDWSDASIEIAWTTGYVGVGWYRRQIELPPRPEHLAAELLFEGVDESAWVWVNGVFVGGQDIGPGGWNRPFRVDVTDQLRWGALNQITVRAMNTGSAGGIWKPITLEALALK